MKRCPPGVICLENVSLFFIIICLIILFYLIYNNKSEKIIINERTDVRQIEPRTVPYLPNVSDVLLNPYMPPLSDERYILPPRVVPINMSTNIGAVDTTYRQMGIMTSLNSKSNIIPLMGRPLFTNRDKWQYYTISDQRNSIKLPISRNGRSCTNEYGCDRLFDGDTVYVEGINEPYKVTIYDNDTIKYLPFI
jgi:hypothetical protein